MQISLITPLFNRLDLTRAYVESARRTLGGWDYEWIFIDDGSTDGTREFLQALAGGDPRVRVVLNDGPQGFAANNNHGARLARSPLPWPGPTRTHSAGPPLARWRRLGGPGPRRGAAG